MRLEEMLRVSAARTPDAPAAFEPGGASIDYRSLDAYSTAIAGQLAGCGVTEGDRIGLCMPKTIAALGSVFGAMKAGGAYVPVDYSAPATRNGFIFSDCEVRAVIADRDLADGLIPNLSHGVGEWRIEDLAGGADRSRAAVIIHRPARSAPAKLRRATNEDALAYILYTSGSTGKPKGVMHSHRTARAFIDWCSTEFSPTANDVFSSHAPFHFDLSILDLYVSIKHGASIVLIDAITGKQPQAIADVIAGRSISIWYSTPSILRMLIDDGVFGRKRFPNLRIVIFAGEVYPPKQLAKLVRAMPEAALYNLYGPTETNVCTYYRTPPTFDELSDPLPIGYPCSDDRPRVVDADGEVVSAGEAGELLIAGGSVMLGYWNLPERNAEAFLRDAEGDWYRTGDIVRKRSDGAFIFIGRRDRMVKRRGYRVELGEIEAALNKHPSVAEAAVVAAPAADGDLAIKAFVAWTGGGKPSIIEMKKHCSQTVPLYMIPDQFIFLDALPKTSTDKIDYQTLKGRA